jgi:carboxyl-terminal processing protease
MKVMLKTVRSVVFGLTILVIGFGIGYELRGTGQIGIPFAPKTVVPLKRDDLDFSQFWEVWDYLQRDYNDPEKIVPKKMIQGAISGMTASLGDPYTMYLPPVENQQSKEDLQGEFDGIGVQLGYKQSTLAVQTPLDEHPAIKQGVKAGDLILHIKDEAKKVDRDTSGISLNEAVTLIRGKKGTPVTIKFYREGKGEFELTIIRDTIVVPSVELEIGDWQSEKWTKNDKGKTAWLKVRRFGDRTQFEWDGALDTIAQKRSQLTGIVGPPEQSWRLFGICSISGKRVYP